ncbi:hypothetical protein [Streptosporangium saharense]|uniref:hypothetical protein n=1 Tax=Streptosporangium saharense TaxID=1706840 RepID=UPI00332D3E5F
MDKDVPDGLLYLETGNWLIISAPTTALGRLPFGERPGAYPLILQLFDRGRSAGGVRVSIPLAAFEKPVGQERYGTRRKMFGIGVAEAIVLLIFILMAVGVVLGMTAIVRLVVKGRREKE